MTRLVIVANGNLDKIFLSDTRSADFIIGVDRGALWLITNNIIPDIAIGDFDSVTAGEFQIIKKKAKRVDKYPRKKDLTDMELAAQHAISLHPKEVVMYGATGHRLDHTMGNIHFLERLHGVGVIRDINNEVRIISGRTTVKKDARYPYISLLPITETIEISLTGFVYNASHAIICRGQTLGISNEIHKDEATIEVHKGKVLLIRSRD